jgi:hypothetical protein
MPRNAENQRVCYRAKCKKAWRDGVIISRFLGIGSGSDRHPLRKSIKLGLREADKVGRGWRTIAGPALSPRSLAAATITDGPGLMWKGGAFEASDARNRKALEDYFAKRAADRIDDRCVCGRTDDLKDVQVNGAWTIVCYGCHIRAPVPSCDIPADLSIPDFLRR